MATVVIALGGNAFVPEGSSGAHAEQAAAIQAMARVVVDLHRRGHSVVVSHGNGPQVGALAIQHEEGAELAPPQPLFVLDAMTQGHLGHLLVTAIHNGAGSSVTASALVTHVVVEPDDEAFEHPSKPIGPFYSREEARALARDRGWDMREVSQRRCRRVVPSPHPVEVLELASVHALVERGTIVVAAGGGGVPVARGPDGRLRGVDAVVDKDRSARVLASALGAAVLIFVTGVPAVAIDYGTEQARDVEQMTVAEADRWLSEGQFPAGSMGPKVESATDFVGRGGQLAIITSERHVLAALEGRHGTRIVATENRAGLEAAG